MLANGDDRDKEKAARAAHLTSLGYHFNPATGTWQLKPKVPRQRAVPTKASKRFLNLPDEDYTESVCFLLPNGHATLIDVRLFEFACRFDWLVMGRCIFRVEKKLVTHVRRRCGIGRTGYGKFRVPGWTKMEAMSRQLFSKGVKDGGERYAANKKMIGKDIDHINRNPWDNRLQNLRIATKSQNAHNKAPAKNKSSQYKGVFRKKGTSKWVARIKVRGRQYHLGTFDDEFKAAQAYNAAVRKYCPEFGYINPLSC